MGRGDKWRPMRYLGAMDSPSQWEWPLLCGCLLALAACDGDSGSFTLYRSSALGDMRIHVASFDAKEGADYNAENCQIAADLFGSQRGVTVRYWCEKGRFRP